MKRLLAFLLAIVSAFGCFATGCSSKISEDDKQNALIIECHVAGYGSDWIYMMQKAYQNKTGKKVIVIEQIGVQGLTNMGTNIKSMTSDTDLFFMGGAGWADVYYGQVTAQGKTYPCLYEDLTDLYNSEIYDEGVTVYEKMEGDNREYLALEGKYHHFPYVAGMQGFIVNKTVWQDSWGQLPRTTDELLEVCAKIVKYSDDRRAADKKAIELAPFIYSMGDEYWTSMLTTFMSQYEGAAAMEEFYKGYGPSGERYGDDMVAYKGAQKALEFFHDLLIDKNRYMHSSSKDLGFTNMQGMFLNGSAVFNCNGDWLEKEMSRNYPNTNIEMMKLPVLSAVADKLSIKNEDKATRDLKLRELIDYVDDCVDGKTSTAPAWATEADIAKVTESRSFERMGAGNCAVIPCYSNQTDMAKDFLRFIASDEGLKIFEENTNGCRPPFDYSNVKTDYEQSGFRQSVNAVMERSSNGGSKNKDRIYSLGGFTPDLFNSTHGRFVTCFAAKNANDYINATQYYQAQVKAVKEGLPTAKQRAGIV